MSKFITQPEAVPSPCSDDCPMKDEHCKLDMTCPSPNSHQDLDYHKIYGLSTYYDYIFIAKLALIYCIIYSYYCRKGS